MRFVSSVLLLLQIVRLGLVNAAGYKSPMIGVLYNDETKGLKDVLQQLLNRHYNTLKNKLIPVNVHQKDILSRHIIDKFCSGYVVMIIDLASKDRKMYALSDILRVPLMRIEALEGIMKSNMTLSVRPSHQMRSRALFDVIKYFRFEDIVLVYDARKAQEASYFNRMVTNENWPNCRIRMMAELILHDENLLRTSLREVLKSRIQNVILLADGKDVPKILKMAMYARLSDTGYKWIASDSELPPIHTNHSEVEGLVGLSLKLSRSHLPQEEGIQFSPVIYAVLNDSLRVLAEAIKKTSGVFSADTKCTFSDSKNEGKLIDEIYPEMKKVNFMGSTGAVRFKNGYRDGFEFSLDYMSRGGIETIGSVKPGDASPVRKPNNKEPKWIGKIKRCMDCKDEDHYLPIEMTEPMTLTVSSIIEKPFVDFVNDSIKSKYTNPTGPINVEHLQGFCIDLIKKLADDIKFKYKIVLSSSYGDEKNGKWTGMVGELVSKSADIALAPITITAEREKVIDFSKPFWDFSMSLILEKPGDPPMSYFAFLQPFTGKVWGSIVGVVLFLTVMMYVVDYFSPFGHRARARDGGDDPGNEFNLFNSLWFATASMLQQGPDNTPQSPSGRLLASAFWFFILIMISTYTANLAAFFTIKRTADAINSLQDLVQQDKIKFGVSKGGATATFLEKSTEDLYRNMFHQMEKKESFADGTKDGIAKVKNGDYAFLTEQPYLDYYNQMEPCNTRLINNLLASKSYGIGLRRYSPYTNMFSISILKLREEGFIERLKKRWFNSGDCPKVTPKKTGSTQSLDVENLAGVFIILCGGVLASIFLILIEIRFKKLVDYLTSGKCSWRKPFNGEYTEPSKQQNNSQAEHSSVEDVEEEFTQVRTRIVISQGEKVLKPVSERKELPAKKGWFPW